MTTGTEAPPRTRGRRVWSLAGRPTVLLTVANIGSQALSFLSGLVIARNLGTVGRGQVSLVQAYDEVSTNVLGIGTPQAAGYVAKERVAPEDQVLGAALKVAMVSLPATALIGWVVARYAFAGFPVGLQVVVWSAIGMTPLANSFLLTCRMILAARGDVKALVPLQFAQMLSRVAVLLVLVALDALTATNAAVTIVACGWFANLLGWRAVGTRPRGGGPVRPLLRYGVKTIPAQVANMTTARLDQILVAPLLSTAALGIYAVAVAVNVVPIAVASAIALAGYHTVTGTPSASAGGERLLSKSVTVITLSSVASAAGIVLLLEPLYGSEFGDAVIPALILVPGSASVAMFTVVAGVGNAIGDPGLAAWAQAVGLIVTVVGLPLLLPVMEVNGAALVSSLAYSIRLAVGLGLLRRRGVKFGLRDLHLFRF